MIYTIGKTEYYEEAFDNASEEEPVKKLGKKIYDDGTEYEGGIVFKTKEDAERLTKLNLPDTYNEYSVYGVIADWETDTYKVDPAHEYKFLLNSCLVVRL